MIAALCLVVSVVILHEERRIIRKRIDDTAGLGIRIILVVFCSLFVQSLPHFISVIRRHLVKVSVGRDAEHIIHGRSDCRLDSCIHGSCIESHTAPSADAEDADAVRIDIVSCGEEIYGSREIFRIDIRGCHVSWRAAAFTGKGRIEGNRQIAHFCQLLCIKSGRLFLHSTERSCNSDGRKLSFCILRCIHICGKCNAVAVMECHLLVID